MEPTLPAIAGTPGAPANIAPPIPSADRFSVEAAEEQETEFWDACWTLEDEMIPRAVVRPEPQSRRIHTIGTPSGFALL